MGLKSRELEVFIHPVLGENENEVWIRCLEKALAFGTLVVGSVMAGTRCTARVHVESMAWKGAPSTHKVRARCG